MTAPASILENDLVWSYFHRECETAHQCKKTVALAVLDAMQQPIRKGELYLGYFFNFEEWEVSNAHQNYNDPFHPAMLRLPDSFQPKGEKETQHKCRLNGCRYGTSSEWEGIRCGYCGRERPSPIDPLPSEVEARIRELVLKHGVLKEQAMEHWLRELVALVRAGR